MRTRPQPQPQPQPQPRVVEVVEVVANAPAPHEGDESVLVAALDTGSRGRSLWGAGAAAVGLVAVAALLMHNGGSRPAVPGPPSAHIPAGSADPALPSGLDIYQSRYSLQTAPPRVPALYSMEGGPPFCVPTLHVSEGPTSGGATVVQ